MKKGSRLLSLILSLILAFGLLPASVWAEETEGTGILAVTEETDLTDAEDVSEEQKEDVDAGQAEELAEQETGKDISEDDADPAPVVEEAPGQDVPEEDLSENAVLEEEKAEEEPAAEYDDTAENILQEGDLFKAVKRKSKRAAAAEGSDYSVLMDRYYDTVSGWDGVSENTFISLSDLSLTHADVKEGLTRFINTHPEFFYLSNKFSYSAYSDGRMAGVRVRFYTRFTLDDIRVFQAVSERILSEISGSWSDEQKALYLHDYLVTHCEYDLTYSNYNAYDALVTGSCVCQGYSLAYKYLLNQCGIDCSVVTSSAKNHAWNLATIDSRNYYVDCTWDDPVSTNYTTFYQDYCAHKNFLRSRGGIVETGHDTTDWVDASGNDLYSNDATSAYYDGAWWSECVSAIPHVGSGWAYVSPENSGVFVHDYSTGTDRQLFEMPDKYWPVWNDPTHYYTACYVHLAAYGQYFYASSANKIYRFTAVDTEPVEIWSLTSDQFSQGYIYGIHTDGNILYYRLYTSYDSGDFAAEYTLSLDALPESSGTAIIRKATASFQGRILLNFYLLLSDELVSDENAYVSITGVQGERQIPLAQGIQKEEGGEALYIFSCPVFAYEIRDMINLKVYDGNDQAVTLTNLDRTNDYTETGVDYSLMTYCTKMLSSASSSDEMKALAQAAIDYGTAAQIYFDHKAEGLTVSDAVTAVTLNDLAGYKGVFEGTMPQGVTGRSLTALFESDNSLRIYFKYGNDADSAAYTYVIDGETVGIRERTSGSSIYYYLEVSNVSADALGDLHSLSVADSAGTRYTIKVSVLTYARSSVANGTEARQNLGKSLYLYNQAAIAKFR